MGNVPSIHDELEGRDKVECEESCIADRIGIVYFQNELQSTSIEIRNSEFVIALL